MHEHERVTGVTLSDVVVVNFSHPLSDEQCDQIAELSGQSLAKVITVPCQVDVGHETAAQISGVVQSVGLSTDEWQTMPIVVVLPGLSYAAGCVLAEIHGRCGYFPTIAILVRDEGPVPKFKVSELLSLQKVREAARVLR